MTKIIQLNMHPFNYPIAFEITGIKIHGTTQDKTSRAIVNDVEVYESFAEVMWLAQKDN